jgi:hypothetical protein
MKKKLMSLALALVMCLTLCIPAFASESMLRKDAVPPSGYSYLSSYDTYPGDWYVDSEETTAGIVTGAILAGITTGPVGATASIFISLGASKLAGHWATLAVGDSIGHKVNDTCYSCDDPGIYPYIYFHVYKEYAKDEHGNWVYLETRTAYEYALLPMCMQLT